MSKATMPGSLRILTLALAMLACCFAIAGSASAATVNLHIESLTDTIYNGQVEATPGPVTTTADSNCLPDSTPNANSTTASSIRALAAWATANSSTYNTQFGGTYLCAIGSIVSDSNQYWMLKVNNKTLKGPGDYWLGTSALSDGDTVLWYYTDDYAKKTLALTLPATVQTGAPVAVSASTYDGNDDSKAAASGVAISGGGASATSAADGSATLSFPAAGRFLVSATKSGAIRSSEWVTVTDAPVVPAPDPNVVKRREARDACHQRYKTHTGNGHRLCIRLANQIGRTVTGPQRRTNARLRCRIKYSRAAGKRARCLRAANRIGR